MRTTVDIDDPILKDLKKIKQKETKSRVAGKSRPVLFEVHPRNRFCWLTYLPDAATHLRGSAPL